MGKNIYPLSDVDENEIKLSYLFVIGMVRDNDKFFLFRMDMR